MARDLKKVKTKELIFDEVELEFLNSVLDYYKNELSKKQLTKLREISEVSMVEVIQNKINKKEWTGTSWL